MDEAGRRPTAVPTTRLVLDRLKQAEVVLGKIIQVEPVVAGHPDAVPADRPRRPRRQAAPAAREVLADLARDQRDQFDAHWTARGLIVLHRSTTV
jgi:hypothetical protein